MTDGTTRKALQKLQNIVRQADSDPDYSGRRMTRGVPKRYRDRGGNALSLVGEACEDFVAALLCLHADLRLEYLADTAESLLWEFVFDAYFDRRTDNVRSFLSMHAREPETLEFWGCVENLSVAHEMNIAGLKLVPRDSDALPTEYFFGSPSAEYCFAVVSTYGTNHRLMMERGRRVLEENLRYVRVVLRFASRYQVRQLRCRLGMHFYLKGKYRQSRFPDDGALGATIDADLFSRIDPALASALAEPKGDIERRLSLAASWLDRSMFAPETLIALLYSFFALEALLGEKSEGLKASSLAFRQAVLDMAVNGHFSHPDRAWILYAEVRSVAVHGGQVPSLDKEVAGHFMSSVWTSLLNVQKLADREGFRRSGQMLAFLDNHPQKAAFLHWLNQNSEVDWGEFLSARAD